MLKLPFEDFCCKMDWCHFQHKMVQIQQEVEICFVQQLWRDPERKEN